MTKKVASAKITGGGGFNYEDFVAARFLLGLLGADHPLGPDLGRLVRIDWQAADSGWRLDDLAITCGEGNSERAVGISIKSHKQVTRSGFDVSFSAACWEQWLGVGTARRLRIDRDQMALVTGELAAGVRTAWEDTLGEAIENAAAPERLVARLQPPAKDAGSQSSETQRAIFASLHCPASLGDARVTDEVQTAVLLRHIRLVHLDFESNPSQARSDALTRCRGLLQRDTAEAAEVLWDDVVRIAAIKRGSGGSIDFPELLAGLRRRHVLKYHPDFRNDWAELDRRSRERFELIRLDVGGVARLPRRSTRRRLLAHFRADRVCVLAGVSGVGKSAIVRAIAGQKHRLVWLTAELLLPAAGTTLEAHLGILHSFAEVVAASPAPCLVVFDGVEGLSNSALQSVARLVAFLRVDRPGKVRVALTVQSEALGRLQWAFALAGLPVGSLGIEIVRPPGGAAVDRLLVQCPGLSVAALRPEFRTLLRNLKVFDWAARLEACGGLADASDVTTLTALIDRLWAYFVEGDSAGLARSALLKRIAATEADGLLQGLPVSEIDIAELALVSPLEAAGLVVRRDERLRLVHDMFADWARLKHLIEQRLPYSGPTIHQAATAGWYRAVRLYAQRLLEQPHGGVDAWQRQLQAVGAETPERAIMRDLFLEALVLAHDSRTLLTAAWPALVAGDGELLRLLIDRFAYVGTVPDARVLSNLPDRAEASKLEHLIRVPFEPYWGGVLEALREHTDDVIRCALAPAARLLKLWLSKVLLRRPGANGLRHSAGQLILAIAREVQAQEAERRGEVEKGDRTEVYIALLWAAPEYPQEVAQLCLELANRRPEAEAAGLRREAAAERGRQMIAARSVADERSARFFLGSLRLEDDSAPKREPWPDGPRHRVDESFQLACLDWQAILPLAANLPVEASEILLAVLIEHPRHHDSDVGSFMYDAFGLDECRPCDPAFYDQGPFWTLLRHGEATAESALTLIIKVANFATGRWRDHQILLLARHGGDLDVGPTSVQMPGPDGLVEHPGDRNVLCWHSGLRTHPSVMSSMLMAVEKWLYDEADAGRPVDRWVGRIFGEGRSAALVGVLVQLGKYKPELLAGPLRPLLGACEIYAMEHRLQAERFGWSLWSMDWMRRGEVAWNRSRDWHEMPHRKTLLLNHFIPMILDNESVRADAINVYAVWEERYRTSPHSVALRSALNLFGVVIRYYRQAAGGESAEGFQVWFQAQKRAELAQELRAAEELLPLTFALQCRKRLDDNCPLTPDEMAPFWKAMQSLANRPEGPTEDGTGVIDSLLGGVAVLMTLHREWLRVEPAREVWCTEQLVRCVRQPPRRRAYDVPESAGSWSWDNFAAECGVALLAENPADPLARRLVLDGMTCFRFATVSATMCRAYRLRTQLGEEFERMKAFVGEWSACVWALRSSEQWQLDTERLWDRECAPRREMYGTSKVHSPKRPLTAIDAEGRGRVGSLFTDHMRQCERRSETRWRRVLRRTGVQRLIRWCKLVFIPQPFPEPSESNDDTESEHEFPSIRRGVPPAWPGLDLNYLKAAFGWLDEATVEDRVADDTAATLIELLAVSLRTVPPSPRGDRGQRTQFPSKFDEWLYERIAAVALKLSTRQRADDLWQPVLALGITGEYWVKYFLSFWFKSAQNTAVQPGEFVDTWGKMLQFALDHPNWDLQGRRWRDGEDMVKELLGFDMGKAVFGDQARYALPVGSLLPEFNRAAGRWLTIPRVAVAFCYFALKPAGADLLLPSVRWLAGAEASWSLWSWEHDRIDEALVTLLREVLVRHQEAVVADADVRQAYSSLCNKLVARGGPAALALRERFAAAGRGDIS